VHGIASKAEVYNVTVPPKIIEEGLNAALEIITYTLADGYKIKAPLFTMKMRLPGEYDGSETRLPQGVFPEARIQASDFLRGYLKERVQVQIDGKADTEGYIAEIRDEAAGVSDEVLTVGNLITVRRYGLKVEADEAHNAQAGVFFKPQAGEPVKAVIIAVNEPKTLKLIVPAGLADGTPYTVRVVTQGSPTTTGYLLKELREITAEFTMTAKK
jgi:hypothetical protein